MQNVVADSFYQGQVTFTCFSKQPVNAYRTFDWLKPGWDPDQTYWVDDLWSTAVMQASR
jgi:hypothetical protein